VRKCARSVATVMRAAGAHFESHLHTRSTHCRVQSWNVAPVLDRDSRYACEKKDQLRFVNVR
jgi:hypothetical protein